MPKSLRVLEIYHDNPFFSTVNGLQDLQTGDVLFVGRKVLPEYIKEYVPKYDADKNVINEAEGTAIIGNKSAGYHTAMYICQKYENGDPLVIDIQKATSEVRIWNLKELMSSERYEVLYKIKRLII